MKIISIVNQKGGVGKTTTTANLAAAFVKMGAKTLCIDLDPQANLSLYLGYEDDGNPTLPELLVSEIQREKYDIIKAIRTNKEGIDYIPSALSLSKIEVMINNEISREYILEGMLRNLELSEYEYILIDCLPSLNIFIVNALTASDSVLIPVQPQTFALSGLGDLMETIDRVRDRANPKLKYEGLVITMNDSTNNSKAGEKSLRSTFNELVFPISVRRTVDAPNSTLSKNSLITMSYSKAGTEYMQIAEIIRNRSDVN